MLALLLFAASPAIGGTVLPAVHPCPVDMPWLGHGTGSGAHAGHGQDADQPSRQPEHTSCSCIGICLTATAVVPPRAPQLGRPGLILFAPVLVSTTDSSLELSPRATLLPPATAPPLV